MAIEFPPNPAIGDTVTGSYGEIYTFDGVKWTLTAGGEAPGGFLPLTGGTLTGPLIAPTVTIGAPSISAPAPLEVGGRGITYTTLGAVGQSIGFAVVSGQLYCYQNGLALAGPFAVTGQLGNYLPIAGGNLTGNLTTTGCLLVGQGQPTGGPTPFQIPAQAVPGNAFLWQASITGLSYNGYWDGSQLRQIPGTGTTNGAPAGITNFYMEGGSLGISVSQPADDNAPYQPGPAWVLNWDGSVAMTAGNGGPVASFNQNLNSDCQVFWTQPNHAWCIGNANQTGNFYIQDSTQAVTRLTIDQSGNFWVAGTTSAIWTLPSGGDNTGYCGAPGGAWAAVCSYDFAQQSDPRGKRDMAPAAAGALEKVNALEVITYRNVPPEKRSAADPDYDRVRTGFDASEIHSIHPDAVTVDKDGNPSGYSLSDMNALLWQAVQELSAKVAELESRLERGAATD